MTVGRKSKYESHVKPRFKEIEKWCKRGATDKEIIKLLGISKDAFYKYKNEYPELNDLIKNNRIDAVEELKNALFKRATGFQYVEKEETKETDEVGNVKHKVRNVVKTVVPDPASALILLKHWAKDEGWTNDPAILNLKKQELEFKKKQAEKENW